MGEVARLTEAQRSPGSGGRRCGGWMGRRSRVLPREICWAACSSRRREVSEARQKSAEAVVAAAHGGEGPNTRSRTGSMRSWSEAGAAKKAEKLEPFQRVGDGSPDGSLEAACQADPARVEDTGDEAPGLMEEVVRRENVLAAQFCRRGLLSFLDEHRRLMRLS